MKKSHKASLLSISVLLAVASCDSEDVIEETEGGRQRFSNSIPALNGDSLGHVVDSWDLLINESADSNFESAMKIVENRVVSVDQLPAMIERIIEAFGPGDYRDRLIATVFMRFEGSSAEIWGAVGQMESEMDQAAAISGVMSKVESGELVFEDGNGLENLSAKLKLNLVRSLYNRAFYLSRDQGLDQQAFDGITKESSILLGAIEGNQTLNLVKFLKDLGKISPRGLLNHVSGNPAGLGGQLRDLARFSLERLALEEGPESTMKIALARNIGVKEVLTEWLRRDSRAALEWADSQSGNSDVAQSFAEYAVKMEEFDTAREWVEKMEAGEARREVEHEMVEVERKVVLESMTEGPQATLSQIIAGDSIHQAVWIDDAFDRWMSTDREKATIWYEQNRQDLSPAHNQYFAKVFANQAIEEGDPQTARAWADQVVDKELSDQIIERISSELK